MDDTLYMGELVEPLGFDSIWATEHYGSAYSMQPNPLQYLAYWAGRTSRVDMGTAVIVAPWWNSVRLPLCPKLGTHASSQRLGRFAKVTLGDDVVPVEH
jgi:hypothetical protein